MRSLLIAGIVLVASSASAQNMWQMNAAYQNQINTAQASAWPVYAPVYVAPRPYYGYRPIYRGGYLSDFDRRQAVLEAQDQTRQLRRMNRTLQFMEWDLQDAARAQEMSVRESIMRDNAWMYER